MLRPLDFIVSKYHNVDPETVPWYSSVRRQYIDACSGFSEIPKLDSSQVAPTSMPKLSLKVAPNSTAPYLRCIDVVV